MDKRVFLLALVMALVVAFAFSGTGEVAGQNISPLPPLPPPRPSPPAPLPPWTPTPEPIYNPTPPPDVRASGL